MTVDATVLRDGLDKLCNPGFSGVVSVSRGDDAVLDVGYGLADRAHQIPAGPATKFGIASGSKGFTALVVASLVHDGLLRYDTLVRKILGADLPLIAADVTVEHLLTHTSGIGDYLSEDGDIDDYVLAAPVHTLDSTAAFLGVLDGHPTAFPAGERFEYCNGGYVVLALIAERTGGQSYQDLVGRLVFEPAGMTASGFLRSDSLPGEAAIGYLKDGRTNVFHLPVMATGDGGVHTTVADLRLFWAALFDGRIVPIEVVDELTRPRNNSDDGRYAAGFWLQDKGSSVFLEGYDAGVSFRSVHDPVTKLTHTVMSNTSEGAWPIAHYLAEQPTFDRSSAAEANPAKG